ncbi:hypothetical protein ACFOD4_01630 [Pseudoroseomonas globiformis]|uniref:ABC transporter permease n=1 Tax=Teichococcus globiformis TaxID=2307229 RepID=A0ABV7FZQ5_9PROT
MDPILRLTFFMSRLWRNPPSRRTALVMLLALGVSVILVLVEHWGWWPEGWRVNPRVTQPGLSRM